MGKPQAVISEEPQSNVHDYRSGKVIQSLRRRNSSSHKTSIGDTSHTMCACVCVLVFFNF